MTRKIALLAAVALLAALPALAQPPGAGLGPRAGAGMGPFGPGPEEIGERLIARLDHLLDLSAAQKDQIEALAAGHRDTVQPLREQERTNAEQLRTLLDGSNPSPAEVGRLVIANHGLREQIRSQRERFDAELSALLTPEQRAAWETAKKLKGGDRRPMRRPGGRPGRR
ncbi:MAG TPA: Spy/CpxP family protein refolding chaperone [Thermoanaerobaculia bacterium]|nr:Spy/CpxP family protein refolding chaperone [Thermoanaerobaculia bacterium]